MCLKCCTTQQLYNIPIAVSQPIKSEGINIHSFVANQTEHMFPVINNNTSPT